VKLKEDDKKMKEKDAAKSGSAGAAAADKAKE